MGVVRAISGQSVGHRQGAFLGAEGRLKGQEHSRQRDTLFVVAGQKLAGATRDQLCRCISWGSRPRVMHRKWWFSLIPRGKKNPPYLALLGVKWKPLLVV